MKRMLSGLIDRFQAKFPPNRLTALAMGILIPFVITPAAAYVAVYVPKHFPGLPTFSVAQLVAFGVAGGGGALLAGITAGYKWLDGWQRSEGATHSRIIEAARRDHEVQLEAMRLDSAERVAIAEQAGSSAEAAYALDMIGSQGPIESASPPPPPFPVPTVPDPFASPPAAAEGPEPAAGGEDGAPPVPLPPQAAAERAAQGDGIASVERVAPPGQ